MSRFRYERYCGLEPLRSGRRAAAQAAREVAKLAQEGPGRLARRHRGPHDRRRPSGARPGATTSSPTATTRTACRAAAPTCATARWSTCRSSRARSRRWSAARSSTRSTIDIAPLPASAWKRDQDELRGPDRLAGRAAAGQALEGRHGRRHGPRRRACSPSPREIEMTCSCPDWAGMCKHVAAVLYGVGARLDHQPELLFLLRKVDHLGAHREGGHGRRPARRAVQRDTQGDQERRPLGRVRYRDGYEHAEGRTGQATEQETEQATGNVEEPLTRRWSDVAQRRNSSY